MTRSICLFRNALALPSRAFVLALGLACAAAPQGARAGEEPGFLTRALGLRTTVPEAPEFVVKTRRQEEDFIPVHTPRKKPAGSPMNKDEVARQEKSLDQARIRHDRLARRPAGEIEKSVADELEPKNNAQARDRAPACGLTCPNPALLPSQPGKEAR